MNGVLYMVSSLPNRGLRTYYRGICDMGFTGLDVAEGARLKVHEQFRSLAFWLGAEAEGG